MLNMYGTLSNPYRYVGPPDKCWPGGKDGEYALSDDSGKLYEWYKGQWRLSNVSLNNNTLAVQPPAYKGTQPGWAEYGSDGKTIYKWDGYCWYVFQSASGGSDPVKPDGETLHLRLSRPYRQAFESYCKSNNETPEFCLAQMVEDLLSRQRIDVGSTEE
jgi:hypothetical protein